MHAFDPAKTSAIKKAFKRHDWLPHGLAEEVTVELQGALVSFPVRTKLTFPVTSPFPPQQTCTSGH
jgi:hypothetical protein